MTTLCQGSPYLTSKVLTTCVQEVKFMYGGITTAIKITFVIVLGVVTYLLFECSTVRSVPAVEAFAFPVTVISNPTLTMAGATPRASFKGAMATIPTRDAEASAILALTVVAATSIAKLRSAVLSSPTLIANA